MKVLVIADAPDIVESVSLTFSMSWPDSEILSAPDAATGIYSADRESPTLVVLDIGLPDMNGYELMMKLKEVMNPLPLVLMTGFGYDAGHSIVKAREGGLKAVLYKPFRLDQLLDTVEMMLK